MPEVGYSVTLTLKDESVSCEEKVQETINEGHVYGDEEYDRLGEKNLERTGCVFDNQFLKVNLDFLLLGVNAPVLCLST